MEAVGPSRLIETMIMESVRPTPSSRAVSLPKSKTLVVPKGT
jgi:hypothetical protein